MKIKHLLIVGLLLAIITVGAVSASENITSDDLAVEDATEDSIEVADDSAIEIADEQEEEVLGDYGHDFGTDSFSMGVDTNIVVRNPDGDFGVVKIQFYQTITEGWSDGTISFKVNGNWSSFNQTVNSSFAGKTVIVKGYQLGITDYGNYELEMWWTLPKYHENRTLFTRTVHVSMIEGEVRNAYGMDYFPYGEEILFNIMLPEDATGSLKVIFNGRTYDVSYKNGRGSVIVKTDGIPLGEHNVVIAYGGDAKYKASSLEGPIKIDPEVLYPGAISMMGSGFISVGEDEYISVAGPATASGYANLIIYSSNGTVYDQKNLTIEGGHASYSLSGLPADYYSFVVEGVMDNYSFYNYNDFRVIENLGGFQVSVSSEITEGGYVSIFMDVPPTAEVTISVDGIPARIYMMRGPIEDLIAGLAVGTHKIKVMIRDSYFSSQFSKTFTVTVKNKPVPVKDVIRMTLKKVKVKKSARKLVLSATLKINGKLAKGKIIKFKFNKKTYKAKTSSKGVAKVTIKKAVLKKLKAGKKVTYTATYGKTVKKITVKVLR